MKRRRRTTGNLTQKRPSTALGRLISWFLPVSPIRNHRSGSSSLLASSVILALVHSVVAFVLTRADYRSAAPFAERRRRRDVQSWKAKCSIGSRFGSLAVRRSN